VAVQVLKVGGSDAQRARTIEEACEGANDYEFSHHILPHCNTILPHCNTILPHCNTILPHCNTILPHCNTILPHCTITVLDSILATATRNRGWKVAGEVLKVGGSEAQRARTIVRELVVNTYCHTAPLQNWTVYWSQQQERDGGGGKWQAMC
jgi:hypothetical protein